MNYDDEIQYFGDILEKFKDTTVYILKNSCVKDPIKSKYLTEIGVYIDFITKNYRNNEERDFNYTCMTHNLSDLICRIYLSFKNNPNQKTDTSEIEDTILNFFVIIGEDIDLNDW